MTMKCHNPYFNRWFSAIMNKEEFLQKLIKVTILILIDGFLQCVYKNMYVVRKNVTILILIDGFLQFIVSLFLLPHQFRHNPYFNRWFSAI